MICIMASRGLDLFRIHSNLLVSIVLLQVVIDTPQAILRSKSFPPGKAVRDMPASSLLLGSDGRSE